MSDGHVPDSVESTIRNRNSWLRVFVIVVLVGVFVWKLADTPVRVDLTRFDFSDLLALILALFAIALSIAFYLKATDTSNTFYDNTYRFTREVSEILGRIEAGFGERLRHLDEGYAGLVDRFERLPAVAPGQVQKQIDDEEKKLQDVGRERDQLVDELAKRAKLQEKEKEQFLANLRSKDQQLEDTRRELAFLQRRLLDAEDAASRDVRSPVAGDDTRVLAAKLLGRLRQYLSLAFIRLADGRSLRDEVQSVLGKLPSADVAVLREAGLVDSDLMLTAPGVHELKRAAAGPYKY